MFYRICKTCSRLFETQHDTTEELACYRCTLDEVRGTYPPEEGDFNTAHIISGEMTDREWRWLQEDLAAVEEGRSIREVDVEEDEYIDWCDICGLNCYCEYDTPETDDTDPVQDIDPDWPPEDKIK